MTKKTFLFLIFNAVFLFSSVSFSKQSELNLVESSNFFKKPAGAGGKKVTGDKAKTVRNDRKSTAQSAAGKVDNNRDKRAVKTVRGVNYLRDKNEEENLEQCPSSCTCTCPAE